MMRANQFGIDFDGIKAAALSSARSLLPGLVPGGKFDGYEYVALNPSRPDKNLGSFKINYRTGKWSDFATDARGSDIISWYAHAYGFDQGEAARLIAEKLGVSTNKSSGADSNGHTTESAPEIFSWGEEGPPVQYNELRRHYYPKNGGPKQKVKIKKRALPKHKWANCYRVFRDDAPVGWQWEKPKDCHPTPYSGTVRDPERIFWPEGEKDVDTLERLGLAAFTFGGVNDLPEDAAKRHLEYLGGRQLVILVDNEDVGRKHAHKKAKFAHDAGVKHIRIFDPAGVWSECPKGGDVTDWIESGGGTRERLLEIVGALPDRRPEEAENTNGASPSWDNPDLSLLDDRRGELPPFPLEVLSANWQSWATRSAHGAGTAIDYVVVPSFAIASSLIGTARLGDAVSRHAGAGADHH
jgi:putative DNA primase/helicase